jgi:gephyrin
VLGKYFIKSKMAVRTQSKYPMISVDEALATVLSFAEPCGEETIDLAFDAGTAPMPVEQLIDRVTAEAIRASSGPLPPFRASIMDGYAVVASDGAGTFDIVGSVTAGNDPAATKVAPGTVAYITTGAPVPSGSDAVVPVEDTEQGESAGQVRILKGVAVGKWIRPVGSDVQDGEVILEKHTVLSAAEIGLIASVGCRKVKLYKKPTVAILSTGDELVNPGESIQGGKIRDSNRPMLHAAALKAGAMVVDIGIVKDQETPLGDVVRGALGKADVVVTSGGVSMGSLDLVKPLLESMGTVHFGRLCMKPGKPTTFATIKIGGRVKLMFGLPGNPVSSLVSFKLLVEPAIKALSGVPRSRCHHSRVHARLDMPIRMDPARPEYHRAQLSWRSTIGSGGEFTATSTGLQRSSRLLSMVSSTALLCIPQSKGELSKGAFVPALLLGNQIPPPGSVTKHMDDRFSASTASEDTYGTAKVGPGSAEEVDDGQPSCPCCKLAGKATSSVRQADDRPLVRSGGSAQSGGTVMRVGVLTVSDRASRGVYQDRGGPEIMFCLEDYISSSWETDYRVVSDDRKQIEAALCDLVDRTKCHIVITTGGTGPSLRDVTPEATTAVCDRIFPGFGERMRQISLAFVSTAILSRQVVGSRGTSIIMNLPGSPGSIRQILPEMLEALAHTSFILNRCRIILKKKATPKAVEADYVVDQVNKDWIEARRRESEGKFKTDTDVVEHVLQRVQSKETDEETVFTVSRGGGRKKVKTNMRFALGESNLLYLRLMQEKYDIPNVQKALRIVLDFALEEEEGY